MKRLVALAACVALAGCGGGGGEPDRSFGEENDSDLTPHTVALRAGFAENPGGISYTGPGGCEISLIMTRPEQIEFYADAGDDVVTNPDGTVGVKFISEPGCREALLERLDNIP